MKMYRQGDVLFRTIDKIPAGKAQKRKNGHILEGEATGHIHRVAETDLAGAAVFECGEGLYVSVTAAEGVTIVHEDHGAITLPAGNYEVIRQRTYEPDGIRNVLD